MPLKIEIELSDEDLDRFRAMFDQARTVAETMDQKELLAATRSKIEEAAGSNPSGFINERIQCLQELITMVDDDAWRLPDEDRGRVILAVAYFVNPDDLIPDQTPGLGFLDDAIAAELVCQALSGEVDAYREFSRFRTAEAQRRANRGLPTDVSKEDWLADQRAVLHSRMRQRTVSEPQGWRTRAFGW